MTRPTPQRAADLFWAGCVVAFLVGDPWREQEDIKAGRTHLTGTTASATMRRGVAAIPGGKQLFTGVVVGLGAWLIPHIIGHLDDVAARW